ncbi:hypothetical protein [Legionella sp. W05-934-2]|uniref:hypothetical protein n=1 Tax=Legionella sp. W05-934-2 TaxID=1198649 RepID=UPI003462A79C
MKRIIICCLLMATPMLGLSNPSTKEWSCLSYDHLNRSYNGTGTSLRGGMSEARKSCIKTAANPSRCRVSHHWCQRGELPPVNEACEAIDGAGKKFKASGNDACELALYQCEAWQRSQRESKRRHCSIIHG